MSIQESFLRHYADHPEELRVVLALSERMAALAELPEESPEVERLVEDFVHFAQTSSLPEEVRRGPDWNTEPQNPASPKPGDGLQTYPEEGARSTWR